VLPPGPLQLSVNPVAGAVSAPVLAEPAVGRPPDHPPLAVHVVASVVDQVSVELPPLATSFGFAVSVTLGKGVPVVTVTVAVLAAVPPGPLQLNVKPVEVVRVPVD
jgi:hypothetical protein